jgi:hypothetical protein
LNNSLPPPLRLPAWADPYEGLLDPLIGMSGSRRQTTGLCGLPGLFEVFLITKIVYVGRCVRATT